MATGVTTDWPGWFCIFSTKMLLLCLCVSGKPVEPTAGLSLTHPYSRFQLYCGFSGQVMIDQMYLMLFNLFFTSLPPVTLHINNHHHDCLLMTRLLWVCLTEMPQQTYCLPPPICIQLGDYQQCTSLTASGSTWLTLCTSLWWSFM